MIAASEARRRAGRRGFADELGASPFFTAAAGSAGTGVEPIPDKDHGRPVSGPYVFDHASLGVESEEMLWELKDRLEVAGFWVSEIINHGFIHSLYSFDPNGIAVEFSSSVAGKDIRKEPRMIDTAPSAVTLEGPEPHFDRWPAVTTPTPPEERKIRPGAGSELFHGKK